MVGWTSVAAVAAQAEAHEEVVAGEGGLRLYVHHRGLDPPDAIQVSARLADCTALQQAQLERVAGHVLFARLEGLEEADRLWLTLSAKERPLLELEAVLRRGSSRVFVAQLEGDPEQLYRDFAAALWAAETTQRFFAGHAQLLAALRWLPPPAASVRALGPLHDAERGECAALWAALEQRLARAEASGEEVGDAVAELGEWPSLASAGVAAWAAAPGNKEALAAARKALRRVHTADVQGAVPTLQTVRLAGLLHGAGVLPADSVAVQLKPAAPPPLAAPPDSSSNLAGLMPNAIPKLQRSKTLVERDADWDKAARAAVRTLGRHHAAQHQLEMERRWAEELLQDCQRQLSLVPGGPPSEALEALSEARRGAAQALQGIADAVAWSQAHGLEKKVREVAERGQELRQRTHQLVKRFGPDVGTFADTVKDQGGFKAYFVSTAAGFHEEPTSGSVDGAPFNAQGGPFHKLSGPRGVAHLGDARWLFTEPGASRLRSLDSNTDEIMTLVGGRGTSGHADGRPWESLVRNPSGLAVIDDDVVLFADSGNHCLRMLDSRPEAGAPQLTTLNHPVRGHCDGPLKGAQFREPCAVVRAGLDVVVAEPSMLRIITGLVDQKASPKVATLCGQASKPGMSDGVGVKALLTAPAGLAVAPWNNRIVFFTDRHCVRAVNLSSAQVVTISGIPGCPGGFKDGAALHEAKFHSPSGLCFLPRDQRTLLVADTQNHLLRAIRFSPAGVALKVETVTGKPGKANWRDGEAPCAQLHSPTGLAAAPDGAVLISELQGHRLRWLWPPEMRLHATKAYMKLREPGGRLTSELITLLRECDIGTSTSEALLDARACLLAGQAAATAAVYRQHLRTTLAALVAMPPADAEVTLNVLLGLAPTPALLSEALSAARASTGPAGPAAALAAGRRAVLARLARKGEGAAAACGGDGDGGGKEAEKAGSAAEAAAGPRLRDGDLPDWVGLAVAHPEVFGTEAAAAVLRAYAGPPCTDLVRLCALGVPLAEQSEGALLRAFEPLSTSLLVAMQEHVRSTLAEKERLTSDKLLRGVLQHWAELSVVADLASCQSDGGAGAAGDLAAQVRVLLRCGLLATVRSRESLASTLLAGVCTGLSIWLGRTDSKSMLFQPFKPSEQVYDIVGVVGRECCTSLSMDRCLQELLHRAEKPKGKDGKDPAKAKDASGPDKEAAPAPQELEDGDDVALLYTLVGRALPSAPADEADVLPWLQKRSPWPRFVIWAAREESRVSRLQVAAPFEPLRALAQRASSALARATAALEDGTADVALVSALEAEEKTLKEVLELLELQGRFAQALRARTAELQEFRADLLALEAACEGRFAPSEAPVRGLEVLRAEMQRFKVCEIRAFFCVGPEADAHPDLPRLPPLLVKATAWLRAHASSAAFDIVWAAASEKHADDVEARLRQCAEDWGGLLNRMVDSSLCFGELEQYAEALSDESALSLFIRSAWSAATAGSDFNFSPPPRIAARVTTDRCVEVVGQFGLLLRARRQARDMERTVELLAKLVAAHSPSVGEALAGIRALCAAVEALPDWSATRVGELGSFSPLLRTIDQRLYFLDDSLLAALHERTEFLGWLAETFPPPDQNFTSAVEMAMGRPEMECPPELWVERTAHRPGHPDEQKLSMLTSVRQALHRYLYREDGSVFGPFASLTDVVDCLSSVPGSAATLVSSLATCGQLHLAFAELLADDADERGATGRLLNLQRPEWAARWRFRIAGAESQLELAYNLPRKGQSIEASQTLAEVLDFQSSVVLARCHGQVAAVVDHFVASFGWAQELAKAYAALALAGHFAYASHESTVPLASPPETLQAEAEKLQEERRRWAAFVAELRAEVPALNWFTMRQLQRLLPLLRGDGASAGEGVEGASPVELFAGIVEDADEAEAALERLVATGREAGPRTGAFEELRLLAQALSAAVPKSVRLRMLRPGSKGVTQTLEAGISICSATRPLEAALTAFLHLGALPEWPLLLYCSQDTTWEEVCNLLHRWTTLEAPQGLFCLCRVDALPSMVAQELAAWLLSRSSGKAASGAALLLVSRSAEHPLMRQLAAFRAVVVTAPAEELQALGAALDGRFSCGAAVLSSRVPGAGKTFAAHTHAIRRRAACIHVPLHRSVGVSELLQRHGRQLTAPGRKLIHVDIVGSTTGDAGSESGMERLEAVLLDLFLLGSFHDATSGHRWAWDPRQTSLCVEVSAAAAIESSALLAALPSVQVVPSASTFCACEAELRAMRESWPPRDAPGTGASNFEAGPPAGAAEALPPPSFGASAGVSDEVNGAVATAEAAGTPTKEDLACVQAVAHALREYEERQGRCSHDFAGVAPAGSGAECFGLLLRALGPRLGAREASLTALFAFARVVRWQLREFAGAFPAGLNSLLIRRGTLQGVELSQLHGELLAFLCRTAADFTFRQERLAPADRRGEWLRFSRALSTTAAAGSGAVDLGSKVEWLQRTCFQSNGQPVFRAGTLMDPTYVHLRSAFWVEENGVRSEGPVAKRSRGQQLEGGWQPGELADHGREVTERIEAAVLTHAEALRECPELDKRDEERALALGEPGGLTSWDEANHEVLLLSRHTQALSFLARDAKLLRRHVHPQFLEVLERCGLQVGEEIHRSSASHCSVMSRVTGVKRDASEAHSLMPGGFVLTGDGLLKLLAIYVRARCGVPVLLQGECGTGKTHMLRYLCKWLSAELCVLDVHGGTSEEDIEGIFRDASQLLEEGKAEEVYVFLDEVNTCAHMDLICEAMCSRSLHGRPIDSRIRVLAAANPCRKRSKPLQAPGLTYQLHREGAEVVDPLQDLVYRVHPMPPSLREFMFDFGGLEPDAELQYIKSMAVAELPGAGSGVWAVVARLLQRAQAFVREAEGDHSAVSLRDVHRSFKLTRWFQKFGAGSKAVADRHPRSAPVLLGLAHVFYFRLPTEELRSDLLRQLRLQVTQYGDATITNFEWLKPPGVMEKVILSTQKGLCSKLVVEEGIAMNAALTENLYITLVCICNRVPVFVIGKPGSSKTLTMQVLASNLQGEQSPSPFWRRFPAIYVFSYQCSPFSTAVGIKHQYEIACNYQRKAQHTMTVLLLDEVGLAEHSPDMPLKVLHGILVQPKVAIVGLSNWTLDAAKMNRTVCLQRPSPTPSDIHLTGVHLLGPEQAPAAPAAAAASGGLPGPPPLQRSRSGASGTAPWLEPLSRAYHAVYTRQRGRDFLGMRDYYQMVRLLWRELVVAQRPGVASRQGGQATFGPELLCRALCRNFGGREDLLAGALELFGKECFGSPLSKQMMLPAADLVRENLADRYSRHLMLLTSYGSALPLMFSHGLVPQTTSVLVGSAFPEDRHSLYLIQHVNRVKAAMAAGETVVLWNLDNIYESLYDVLNQRYVVRTSGGKTRRSLRLAIGARSQLCPVEEGFRLVVVVEKEHAYNDLDLPLLNRFEKSVVEARSLLTAGQVDAAAQLEEWMTSVVGESSLQDASAAFCGVHAGLAESLALARPSEGQTSEEGEGEPSRDAVAAAAASLGPPSARESLAALATPFAVMRSPKLQAAVPDYGEAQASLRALLAKLGPPGAGAAPFALVLTRTPMLPLSGPWTSVRLSDVPSEARLVSLLDDFYRADAGADEQQTMVVQCDPQLTPQFMIDHARLIAGRCAQSSGSAAPRRCVFLVHLPSSHRVRHYAVNFHGGWSFYFVDEARPESEVAMLSGLSTQDLLRKPLHDLVKSGAIQLRPLLCQRLQPAMATIAAPGALPLQDRTISVRQTLEQDARLAELVESLVLRGLESLSTATSSLQVPFHVELALGQLSAGSLSMSLNVAVDALLTRALAHALSLLDVNSALDTLVGLGGQGKSEQVSVAWLALAEALLDPAVISTCRFDGLLTGRGAPTRNTGTCGHMQARFPFSHRLQPQLRAACDAFGGRAAGDADQQDWDAWCVAQLGERVWRSADALRDPASGYHLGYLHDVVLGGGASVLPGLEGPQQLELHRLVLARRCPDALKTLPGIHWAVRKHEALAFGLGAALALLSVEEQQAVLEGVESSAGQLEAPLLSSVESSCWTRLQQSTLGAGRAFAARLTAAAEDLAPLSLVPGGLWLSLRTAAALAAHGPVPRPLLDRLRGAGPRAEEVLREVAAEAARAGDAPTLATVVHALMGEGTAHDETLRLAAEVLTGKAPSEPVRRTLAALLCSRGAVGLALERSPALEVLQLLLAYEEDANASASGGRGERGFSQALPPLPSKAADLADLAAARRRCDAEAGQLLAEAGELCRARERKEKFAPPARSVLQECATPALATYGLASLYARGGLAGVAQVLLLPPERTAWLGITSGKTIAQEVYGLREGLVSCDPFVSMLGEPYESAVQALLDAATSGSEAEEVLLKSGLPVSASAAALLMRRLAADRESHRQNVAERSGQPLQLDLERWAAAPRAQLQLRWMQGACSGPSGQHPGASRAVRSHSREVLSDASVAQGLFTLTFHAVGLAAACPEGGFLREAVHRPEILKAVFLPGMPWDEGQLVYEAMRAERVVWYRCPKGHLYSVGECGGPVMQTRCSHPGCGATIGGRNHTPAAGNRRVGTFYEMHRDRGSYLSSYVISGSYCSASSYEVARLSYRLPKESVCFYRLLLHLLLIAGAEIYGADHPQRLLKDLRLPELVKRLELDFETLQRLTEWKPSELILGLHQAFSRLEPILAAAETALRTPAECERFEALVEDGVVRPTFTTCGCRRAILAEVKKAQNSATERVVRRHLGERLWLAMQEEAAPGVVIEAEPLLWRIRKRASFEHMVALFHQRGADTNNLPLLRAFLRNEERLPLIRMLRDVLAWHSVLFSALGGTPLTREEAAQRTNDDVIESLPEGERASAREVLERFCCAFNTALPRLPNLWECQRNPFLDGDGSVDLSMGSEPSPVRMDGAAPLHFSLPSHPPGPLADAPGLCTIQILNLLVRIHNEVCQEVAAIKGGLAAGAGAQEPAAAAEAALTVTAETPPELLGRRLIAYSRERDMPPLLFEFSRQSLAYGEGGELDYDLPGMEAAIADRVLAGKRPLALQVRHYIYAGESRARGGLAALQLVLPQAPALPPAMAAALPAELDTREQALRFLGLLEEAIHFLVAVGSQPAGDRDTPLAAYLRDVVMISKDRLAGGLPPSVAQQASLRHLRALFLLAEDRLQSSVGSGGGGGRAAVLLPSVLQRYRAPLPEELRAALAAACARCAELEAVVPVLHDLLTGVLSDDATSYGASESLAEFLIYEDVSLEAQPWFGKHFPPDLRLGHALEAFRAMTAMLAAPGV